MIREFFKIPGVAAAISQLVPIFVGTGILYFLFVTMLQPMLDKAAVDYKAHQEIVDKQKEQCTSMERTSTTLKETSTIQERIVDRLERMLDK